MKPTQQEKKNDTQQAKWRTFKPTPFPGLVTTCLDKVEPPLITPFYIMNDMLCILILTE